MMAISGLSVLETKVEAAMQRAKPGDEHFSAKMIWTGRDWVQRDLGECPFGNRHYAMQIAPGIVYAVYCHQCEPQAVAA